MFSHSNFYNEMAENIKLKEYFGANLAALLAEKIANMFTEGYWLMPVAKFVESYGLGHYEISIKNPLPII